VTRRPRLLSVLGLSAVAAVTTLTIVAIARLGGDDQPSVPLVQGRVPVTVKTDVTPRTHLFGDTLVARIDVVIDREGAGASPRLERSFTPYVPESVTTVRRDAGRFTQLRYTFRLRCLTAACLSPSGRAQVRFAPVRVHYRSASGTAAVARASWPPVELYSRLASVPQQEEEGSSRFATPVAAPWRADLTALPAVSHRLPPTLVMALLLLAAALFVLAACVLVYRALPRRKSLSWESWLALLPPVERALAVLERARTQGDATARRRALERLGMELRAHDAEVLARAALELAWAETTPTSAAILSLEEQIRHAGDDGQRRAA
jgi:hypothetical protein